MKLWIVVAALGLSACAEKQISQLSYVELKQVAAKIDAICNAAGATAKSPERKACVDQEVSREVDRRALSAANANRARLALAAGATGFSQGYNNALAAQPRQQRCTSYISGSTLNTNCY